MKISEITKTRKTIFSIEIFPPKKTSSIDTVYATLDELKDVSPDFISVTYGAGGNGSDNLTCEISSQIKHRYGIEPLAHLTCVNSDRTEINQILDQLKNCGIENILALRGDVRPDIPPKTDFRHASDLIRLIAQRGDFEIVAACYPEGHPECGGLDDDIAHLKEKVDAGASHLISQLFFDNDDFYFFLDKIRGKGIDVPIEAGIMPITNKRQIERMVSLCGASLPKKFVKMINRYEYNDAALLDAGISYANEQIIDLISSGVDGIHLYTMNNPVIAKRIYDSIKNIIGYVNR